MRTLSRGEIRAIDIFHLEKMVCPGSRSERRALACLRERLAEWGLTLHPEKMRLIEFGRNAPRNRRDRGEGKPESFTFLGVTHSCGKTGRRMEGPSAANAQLATSSSRVSDLIDSCTGIKHRTKHNWIKRSDLVLILELNVRAKALGC